MECEKDFETWCAIITFADKIRKYAAATKAYQNLKQQDPFYSSNPYIQLSSAAIWQQLLLDISKIFDEAKTFKNENCSIEMLKELCQQTPKFSTVQKAEIIQQATMLQNEYNQVITKEYRNKHLAHADLQSILNNQTPEVSFESLTPFIEHVSDFLSTISSPFLKNKATLRFNAFEDITHNYEEALLAFLNKPRTMV